MNECLICYDHKADQEKMVFLECLHVLCQTCLTKLQKDACPFCRTQINRKVHIEKFSPKLAKKYEEQYGDIFVPAEIRVRTRRRRRRTITERVDTDRGTIILETGIHRDKREKNRRKSKHNRHKNKWACSNARNFGRRLRM